MPERILPSAAIVRAAPHPGPARRISRRHARRFGDEYIFKYVMLSPAVLWVVALTFFPLFEVIRYSFANYVLGEGITGYVGFSNYAKVLDSARFWNSILITVIYVLLTVPIEV
ncbi:MAG TPA: hypothetical protein VG848_00935, partial [Acetobacteraceae bacterium]|nr:hypothetical protein [Acetobacteraceae bacterium]